VENLWQFLRNTRLSNSIFKTYNDIVDIARHAWNQLVDQSWRITSVGLRNWTHGFYKQRLVLDLGEQKRTSSLLREGLLDRSNNEAI
jgi:hypothetical protein